MKNTQMSQKKSGQPVYQAKRIYITSQKREMKFKSIRNNIKKQDGDSGAVPTF